MSGRLINFKQQKLQNVVMAFVFGSILVTLLVAGLSINGTLSRLYGNNARTNLDNAYRLLVEKIRQIESDAVYNSFHIATSTHAIATTHLVNHYQDKSDYQSLIFDNDKKKIARELLERIAENHSGFAALYDNDGELIAFAYKDEAGELAGIQNYKGGKSYYLIRSASGSWRRKELASSLDALIKRYGGNKNPIDSQHTAMLYAENCLTMGSSKPVKRILPDGTHELLGYTVFANLLDDKYFNRLSSDTLTKFFLISSDEDLRKYFISGQTFGSLGDVSKKFGNLSDVSHELMKHDRYYMRSYRLPVQDKSIYLMVYQPKEELVSALNETRISLMLVFAIIAFASITVGVLILNKMIVKPVAELVNSAKVTTGDSLPVFRDNYISAELSQLGRVLNSMVNEIRERGSRLEKNTKQLRYSQKMARLGSWKLEHTNNSMEWSDELYEIFDIHPGDIEPSNTLFQEFIHPEDKKHVNSYIANSISDRRNADLTFRIILKSGLVRHVRLYFETEYDPKGNPLESTGTLQDVTEQSIKDEQLRRTQKMDALDQLTSGIAHDFNNSLSVILGFAELIKMNADEMGEDTEYISDIIQAGERAKKLTAKLMSFTRKEVSSPGVVDINQLLFDEQNMLQKTLTVRINLKLELEKDVWPVWLDKDELEDAIVNMSINSLHAMPDGGDLTLKTLNVSLHELDVQDMEIKPGDYVLLTITDTGTGMDKETLRRVFEPFYSTKKDKGTGLGMSQVYGFVKRSGGEIRVYSEEYGGTRIHIYIPRMVKKVNTSTEHLRYEKDEDLTGYGVILVVDDEPALRHYASTVLTDNGYTVFTASDAIAALEFLKTRSVDLVLSDVIMPGMSGYEMAIEIQQLYPKTLIQMVSGYAENIDKNAATEILHAQRLLKPYKSVTLLRRIKYLLKQAKNISSLAS